MTNLQLDLDKCPINDKEASSHRGSPAHGGSTSVAQVWRELRQEDVGFEASLGYLIKATNLILPNQILDFILP